VRAGRDERGVVTGLEFSLDVGDRRVEFQRDAHVQDAADLGVQDVAWQPVLRYAVAHHAAGRGARILDGDRVTHTGEVVGGGQAGRPRAYHQHPLTRRRRVDGNLPALAERLVAEEPLHRVDTHGRVQLSPVAGGLARPVADPAHDGRERIVLHDLPPGSLVLRGTFFRVVQPLLDVLACGVCAVARRQVVHVNRALGAPGAGAVGPARPDVQGDRERFTHVILLRELTGSVPAPSLAPSPPDVTCGRDLRPC